RGEGPSRRRPLARRRLAWRQARTWTAPCRKPPTWWDNQVRGVRYAPRIALPRTSRSARAGPSLALVHSLDARDGDRTPLFDQIGAQHLRLRQQVGPRMALGDQPRRSVHREVRRRNAVELVPGHRERHWHARPHARAVRGHHRRAAHSGGVDEDLAAPVLANEGGRCYRG